MQFTVQTCRRARDTRTGATSLCPGVAGGIPVPPTLRRQTRISRHLVCSPARFWVRPPDRRPLSLEGGVDSRGAWRWLRAARPSPRFTCNGSAADPASVVAESAGSSTRTPRDRCHPEAGLLRRARCGVAVHLWRERAL